MKKLFHLIILCGLTTSTFASGKLIDQVSLGTNINKFVTEKNSIEKYYYSPGFILAISKHTDIYKFINVKNDIYYEYQEAKRLFNTVTLWGDLYYIYKMQYIRFTSLLDFNIVKNYSLLTGLDVGKLLKSELLVTHDQDTFEDYSEDFTDIFPSIDISFCFGLSKKLDLTKNVLVFEIKYLRSLTEYNFTSDYSGLSADFANNRVNCTIGYRF